VRQRRRTTGGPTLWVPRDGGTPGHMLAASRLRATPHSFFFVLIVLAAAREPRGPPACVPRDRPARRPGGIVGAPLMAGSAVSREMTMRIAERIKYLLKIIQ